MTLEIWVTLWCIYIRSGVLTTSTISMRLPIRGHGSCDWLFACLLFHLDYGFREAPTYKAIGAPMVNDTYKYSHDQSYAGVLFNAAPFFFDFSCKRCHYTLPVRVAFLAALDQLHTIALLGLDADNLQVILVLVAIITGIVIDSFGARHEQDDDKSILTNSCESREACKTVEVQTAGCHDRSLFLMHTIDDTYNVFQSKEVVIRDD